MQAAALVTFSTVSESSVERSADRNVLPTKAAPSAFLQTFAETLQTQGEQQAQGEPTSEQTASAPVDSEAAVESAETKTPQVHEDKASGAVVGALSESVAAAEPQTVADLPAEAEHEQTLSAEPVSQPLSTQSFPLPGASAMGELTAQMFRAALGETVETVETVSAVAGKERAGLEASSEIERDVLPAWAFPLAQPQRDEALSEDADVFAAFQPVEGWLGAHGEGAMASGTVVSMGAFNAMGVFGQSGQFSQSGQFGQIGQSSDQTDSLSNSWNRLSLTLSHILSHRGEAVTGPLRDQGQITGPTVADFTSGVAAALSPAAQDSLDLLFSADVLSDDTETVLQKALTGSETMVRSSALGRSGSAPTLPQMSRALEERFQIFKQVEQRLFLMKQQHQREIQMQLEPAHLGKLNLRLQQEGQVFHLHILAESPLAKEILDGQMQQLKAQFVAQGFELAQVEVNVNSDSSEGFQQSNAEQAAFSFMGPVNTPQFSLFTAPESPVAFDYGTALPSFYYHQVNYLA